ncbi:MAG: ribose transport system substrate-binding protein [Verrucomicrobiales bacterium]|jgi:ribose transport system substrate-binding protein
MINGMNRRIFTRRLSLFASSLALAAMLPGCGEKKTKVAFVTNGASDFWIYAQAGIAKAEEELGDIKAIYKVGGDAGVQRKVIDDLLVSGVEGVAFSPSAPKEQTDHIKTWAGQAKVMTVDSDAPDSARLLYLGTDNVAAGRQCGDLVKEALPDGGKIMVFVGHGDQLNAVERFEGLKQSLEGSNVEIIDLRTDGVDMATARRNAEDTIVNHPDIAGMVGLFSYNAPQILAAVREAGKVGQIKIVGFDEDAITLKAIDAGEIHGTICQQPYKFGYESIKMLHRLVVKGEKIEAMGLPENRQIIIDTIMLRKGEGLDYLAKCDAWKAEM